MTTTEKTAAKTAATDPRTSYAGALDWAADVLAAVTEEQRGNPTPCPEFDVAGLSRHLVATVYKIAAIGEGADPLALPFQVDGTLAEARAEYERVWTADALDREVRVPWGLAPGRMALWGYVNELLVHTWDIAVATGLPVEAPAGVAEPALAVARMLIPAEREGFPFAAPVEPAAEAGPTERLANWSGHARP